VVKPCLSAASRVCGREIQGKLKRYHANPSIIQNHRRIKLLPQKTHESLNYIVILIHTYTYILRII
jgi:hypothetical protein